MRALILLIVLLLSSTAIAQDIPSPDGYDKPPPVETIPPGDDVIKPVRKGQAAPFDGQLFDVDTAIRWAFWLQQYKYRLDADAQRYQQVCKVEKNYRDKKLEIEKDRGSKVEKDLKDRLLRSEKARLAAEEEARNPPWYNTRTFGVIVGVVATVGVMALGIWALEARQ